MQLEDKRIIVAERFFELFVIKRIFIICLLGLIAAEGRRIEDDFSTADLGEFFQQFRTLSRHEILIEINVGSRCSESLNLTLGASESLGVAGDDRLGRDENVGVGVVHREA